MSAYEIFGFFLLFSFFYVVAPTLICFIITGKMLQKHQQEQQRRERTKVRKKAIEAMEKQIFLSQLEDN